MQQYEIIWSSVMEMYNMIENINRNLDSKYISPIKEVSLYSLALSDYLSYIGDKVVSESGK